MSKINFFSDLPPNLDELAQIKKPLFRRAEQRPHGGDRSPSPRDPSRTRSHSSHGRHRSSRSRERSPARRNWSPRPNELFPRNPSPEYTFSQNDQSSHKRKRSPGFKDGRSSPKKTKSAKTDDTVTTPKRRGKFHSSHNSHSRFTKQENNSTSNDDCSPDHYSTSAKSKDHVQDEDTSRKYTSKNRYKEPKKISRKNKESRSRDSGSSDGSDSDDHTKHKGKRKNVFQGGKKRSSGGRKDYRGKESPVYRGESISPPRLSSSHRDRSSESSKHSSRYHFIDENRLSKRKKTKQRGVRSRSRDTNDEETNRNRPGKRFGSNSPERRNERSGAKPRKKAAKKRKRKAKEGSDSERHCASPQPATSADAPSKHSKSRLPSRRKRPSSSSDNDEHHLSIKDIEATLADPPYFKPDFPRKRDSNNFECCAICKSYFDIKEDFQSCHLYQHKDVMFSVSIPSNMLFYTIEEVVEHFAGLKFIKEELFSKMHSLNLVKYPESLVGYSCAKCPPGKRDNFRTKKEFRHHFHGVCEGRGSGDKFLIVWCKGCHRSFKTKEDLTIHFAKCKEDGRCIPEEHVIDKIFKNIKSKTSLSTEEVESTRKRIKKEYFPEEVSTRKEVSPDTPSARSQPSPTKDLPTFNMLDGSKVNRVDESRFNVFSDMSAQASTKTPCPSPLEGEALRSSTRPTVNSQLLGMTTSCLKSVLSTVAQLQAGNDAIGGSGLPLTDRPPDPKSDLVLFTRRSGAAEFAPFPARCDRLAAAPSATAGSSSQDLLAPNNLPQHEDPPRPDRPLVHMPVSTFPPGQVVFPPPNHSASQAMAPLPLDLIRSLPPPPLPPVGIPTGATLPPTHYLGPPHIVQPAQYPPLLQLAIPPNHLSPGLPLSPNMQSSSVASTSAAFSFPPPSPLAHQSTTLLPSHMPSYSEQTHRHTTPNQSSPIANSSPDGQSNNDPDQPNELQTLQSELNRSRPANTLALLRQMPLPCNPSIDFEAPSSAPSALQQAPHKLEARKKSQFFAHRRNPSLSMSDYDASMFSPEPSLNSNSSPEVSPSKRSPSESQRVLHPKRTLEYEGPAQRMQLPSKTLTCHQLNAREKDKSKRRSEVIVFPPKPDEPLMGLAELMKESVTSSQDDIASEPSSSPSPLLMSESIPPVMDCEVVDVRVPEPSALLCRRNACKWNNGHVDSCPKRLIAERCGTGTCNLNDFHQCSGFSRNPHLKEATARETCRLLRIFVDQHCLLSSPQLPVRIPHNVPDGGPTLIDSSKDGAGVMLRKAVKSISLMDPRDPKRNSADDALKESVGHKFVRSWPNGWGRNVVLFPWDLERSHQATGK